MSDYQELLKKYNELQKQFTTIYKANEQKKKDNFKLRGQNRWLLNRCNELTMLVNTFTEKR